MGWQSIKSAPICIDCAYYKKGSGPDEYWSKRLARCTLYQYAEQDPVTGEVDAKGDLFCLNEREDSEEMFGLFSRKCGRRGRYFQPKEGNCDE